MWYFDFFFINILKQCNKHQLLNTWLPFYFSINYQHQKLKFQVICLRQKTKVIFDAFDAKLNRMYYRNTLLFYNVHSSPFKLKVSILNTRQWRRCFHPISWISVLDKSLISNTIVSKLMTRNNKPNWVNSIFTRSVIVLLVRFYNLHVSICSYQLFE